MLQTHSMGVVCANDVMKVGKSYAFDISKSLTYDSFLFFRINSKYVAYVCSNLCGPSP